MRKLLTAGLIVAAVFAAGYITAAIYKDVQQRFERYATHELTKHDTLAAEEQQRIKANNTSNN